MSNEQNNFSCFCSATMSTDVQPNTFHRIKSISKMGPIDSKADRKVLVIYTGGTIGMVRNENGVLAPMRNILKTKISLYNQLHDADYYKKRFGEEQTGYFILPCSDTDDYRILYNIIEYEPLLDSSNMTMNEWIRIAVDIKRNYQVYDGFVILHGTDTLTYTASALSFMFEDLGKNVVITGAQIPIFETRSDGKNNFSMAIFYAGNFCIPEVTVFFGNKLFRGNRTIKISASHFDAFDSPNIAPLSTSGMTITVDHRNVFRPNNIDVFKVHPKLNQNVGILRIFPSMSVETIKSFMQPPIEGVVLQSYGAGNIPSNRTDILQILQDATNKGVLIVNCTQCTYGSVKTMYETGHVLSQMGVLSGADMTPEAALSKLSYVLSKSEWDLDMKKKMMEQNLRGELTPSSFSEKNEFDLVEAVASSLNLTTSEDIYNLKEILYPSMVMSAVLNRNIHKLEMLKKSGVDLSAQNIDKRNALHIACIDGNLEIVGFLMRNGLSVHARDRHDRTPLLEAIENDRHHVIKLLIKCGAHLTGSVRLIGEQLCLAASRTSILRLQSYKLAGADLSLPDSTGRTALHIACILGNIEMIEYLLSTGCDPLISDMTGQTALQIAQDKGNQKIVDILLAKGSTHNQRLSI